MDRYKRLALCFALSCSFVGCISADDSVPHETHAAVLGDARVLTPLDWDFGYVSAGSTVEHDFWIQNDTSDAWQIAEVMTSCSCTLARLQKSTVAPGERLLATVAYTAAQESYDDKQSVTLRLSGTENTPIVLTVRANVREALQLIPGNIGRQTIGTGARKTLPLTVESFGNAELSDFELVAVSNWLRFETGTPTALHGNAGAKHRWKVQCIIDSGDLAPGSYTTSFQLLSRNFAKTFTVDLLVTAPVTAIPHRMFFDDISREDRRQKTITIQVGDHLSATDLYADARFDTPKWLSISVKIEGNIWRLTGTLIEMPDVSNAPSEIVIRFNDTLVPDLRIPVFVFSKDEV